MRICGRCHARRVYPCSLKRMSGKTLNDPAAAGRGQGDDPPELPGSVDVVRQAGITYRQLDHWVRRRFVRPEPSRHGGTGFSREFAPEEVRVACVMGRLTAVGVSLELAARIARSGQSRNEVSPGVVIEVTDDPAGGGFGCTCTDSGGIVAVAAGRCASCGLPWRSRI